MSEPEPAEKKPGKFSKLKSAFRKTDAGQEPFSSFDGHPYDRSSKGFSTLRSEFLFGKILKLHAILRPSRVYVGFKTIKTAYFENS